MNISGEIKLIEKMMKGELMMEGPTTMKNVIVGVDEGPVELALMKDL
jgi:hypothetical protein